MAIIKNVLKHSLGDASNIKGYIPAADRLKIRRAKDGSINLNSKSKLFQRKQDAIRSEIIDKKSNKEFGSIYVDGVHKHGKFNTGIKNIKSLGDVKFANKSVTKKSSKKRAKATKATSLTDDLALNNYMRYKQITKSEMTPFNYQELEKYITQTRNNLRDFKGKVKAQRLIDGDATDGHLVSPHDLTAINSARQRFIQPGKNYIDDNGDKVIGNYGQGEASGQLDRMEKLAMGIPTNWYEDLVMFFDPSQRGIRESLDDKTINEIVTKRNWKGAFKKANLNAKEIFTGDYEGVGRALDVFD